MHTSVVSVRVEMLKIVFFVVETIFKSFLDEKKFQKNSII